MEQLFNILLENPHPLESKIDTCDICGLLKECDVGCHHWPKLNIVTAKCASCKNEEHTQSRELLKNLQIPPNIGS